MVFCSQCGNRLQVENAKFCTQCGAAIASPAETSLHAAFRAFDRDGSGSLSADEIVGILTREGGGAPMNEREARAFVAYFDTDGNGSLDYSEFVAAMQPGSLLGTWVVPGVQQAVSPAMPQKQQQSPAMPQKQQQGSSWKVGDRVLAKAWDDGWYGGHIDKVNADGKTFAVRFDDEDYMKAILASNIKPFAQQQGKVWKYGDRVTAKAWDGAWYKGHIDNVNDDGKTFAVRFDDGDYMESIPAYDISA